ncbi:hypothetical protein AT981_02420 [Streptococcus pneumoniae]|nr:hypothetical protein AT981_02420 [Streptococcus pneumoniae]
MLYDFHLVLIPKSSQGTSVCDTSSTVYLSYLQWNWGSQKVFGLQYGFRSSISPSIT